MNRRRSRRPRQAPASPALPALRAFARGYLHQDVTAEYGGARQAAAAFVKDASADELAALVGDLSSLLLAAHAWTDSALADYFTSVLESAWAPRSIDDVRALDDALRRNAG